MENTKHENQRIEKTYIATRTSRYLLIFVSIIMSLLLSLTRFEQLYKFFTNVLVCFAFDLLP